MKKIYLFLILIVIGQHLSYSQKQVFQRPLPEGTSLSRKISFAIPNDQGGELVLFIEGSDETKSILINSSFQFIAEAKTEKLPKSFKEFIGYQVNDNGTYTIFFTNNSNKKFGIIHRTLRNM